MKDSKPLKDNYEAVIVGAGCHGLSLAYNLAKGGLDDILIIDKKYVGSGATGRNAEGIQIHFESPQLSKLSDININIIKNLSNELNYNLLLHALPHLWVYHETEKSDLYQSSDEWIEKSDEITKKEAMEIEPALYFDSASRILLKDIMTLRHDALAWGYLKRAKELGVQVSQFTELLDIGIKNKEIDSISTTKGKIKTNMLINASGISSSHICSMAGVKCPTEPYRLQALVTESLKKYLSSRVVVNDLVYFFQTLRGETVVAGNMDYTSVNTLNTDLDFIKTGSRNFLKVCPKLGKLNLLRQWAGLVSQSFDGFPILGPVESVKGFIVDCGWSDYGLTTSPVAGKLLANSILTGKVHPLLKVFSHDRVIQNKPLPRDTATQAGLIL